MPNIASSLREDNADLRLTAIGRELGLVDDARWQAFCHKRDAIERETERLQQVIVRPSTPCDAAITAATGQALDREYRALELLRRPEIRHDLLWSLDSVKGDLAINADVMEQIEIQLKYAGYIQRQDLEIERQQRHEQTTIPIDFSYADIPGLSAEVQQKLQQVRPVTIGQAARIPGVTPAAIAILLVYLKRQGVRGATA